MSGVRHLERRTRGKTHDQASSSPVRRRTRRAHAPEDVADEVSDGGDAAEETGEDTTALLQPGLDRVLIDLEAGRPESLAALHQLAMPKGQQGLWISVFLRGLLDAFGSCADPEPSSTESVWTARAWLLTDDFYEVVDCAGLCRKHSAELARAVLARPPIEKGQVPRLHHLSMVLSGLKTLKETS